MAWVIVYNAVAIQFRDIAAEVELRGEIAFKAAYLDRQKNSGFWKSPTADSGAHPLEVKPMISGGARFLGVGRGMNGEARC